VKVSDEIVAWAGGELSPVLAAARPAMETVLPVRVVGSEAEAMMALPPAYNPRLVLVGLDALSAASPGFRAMLASRPGSWPPIVLFGSDAARLKAVDAMPNSRVLVGGADSADRLARAAMYWGELNLPLELA
jgi:hypothetical protein